MKRLHLAAAALSCAVGIAAPAFAQTTGTTAVTTTNTIVIAGHPATGTVTFTPVAGPNSALATGQAIGIQAAGIMYGQQSFSSPITAGLIPSGFSVPDECVATSLQANTSVQYAVSINDTASGKSLSLQGVQGVCGSTFVLNSYVPLQAAVPVPTGIVKGSTVPATCAGSSLFYTTSAPYQVYGCQGSTYVLLTGSGAGAAIALQTSGVANPLQTKLNLLASGGATIAADSVGGVTIAADAPGAAATEQTRATAAEQTNASAINAEATRAQGAEGTNSTAIVNEVTRAKAAEGANSTSISNEVTARGTAVTAEASSRSSADTTLQGNIAAETARAQGIEAISLRNQGTYSANSTYAVSDVVLYNGTYYVSIAAGNTKNTPSGGATGYWNQLGAAASAALTAQSCGTGQHLATVTAAGVFTCTADATTPTATASAPGTVQLAPNQTSNVLSLVATSGKQADLVPDTTVNTQTATQISTAGDSSCPALDSTKPTMWCQFAAGWKVSVNGGAWVVVPFGITFQGVTVTPSAQGIAAITLPLAGVGDTLYGGSAGALTNLPGATAVGDNIAVETVATAGTPVAPAYVSLTSKIVAQLAAGNPVSASKVTLPNTTCVITNTDGSVCWNFYSGGYYVTAGGANLFEINNSTGRVTSNRPHAMQQVINNQSSGLAATGGAASGSTAPTVTLDSGSNDATGGVTFTTTSGGTSGSTLFSIAYTAIYSGVAWGDCKVSGRTNAASITAAQSMGLTAVPTTTGFSFIYTGTALASGVSLSFGYSCTR